MLHACTAHTYSANRDIKVEPLINKVHQRQLQHTMLV